MLSETDELCFIYPTLTVPLKSIQVTQSQCHTIQSSNKKLCMHGIDLHVFKRGKTFYW